MIEKLIQRQPGLTEKTAERADGDFLVQRHDADPSAVIWIESLQNHMAAALPGSGEARPL